MRLIKFNVVCDDKNYYFTINNKLYDKLNGLIVTLNLIGYKTKWEVLEFEEDNTNVFNVVVMGPLSTDILNSDRIAFRVNKNYELEEDYEVMTSIDQRREKLKFKDAIDKFIKKIN